MDEVCLSISQLIQKGKRVEYFDSCSLGVLGLTYYTGRQSPHTITSQLAKMEMLNHGQGHICHLVFSLWIL